MSVTQMKKVWPGERADVLAVFENSHGTCPVIWSQISMHYLGWRRSQWILDDAQLWPVFKRPDMKVAHRAVMLMTYDNAVIQSKDYQRAADDIETYLKDFPAEEGRVNHWPEIARILRSNPDCPAVGFWGTSLTKDPFSGSWNEEAGTFDDPDWNKFWCVYATADLLNEEETDDE